MTYVTDFFHLDVPKIVFDFCSLTLSNTNLLTKYNNSVIQLIDLLRQYNAELTICTDNGPISETMHKFYEWKISEASLQRLDLDQPACGINIGLAKVGGFTISGVPPHSEGYLKIKQLVYETMKLFMKIRTMEDQIESSIRKSPILSQANLDFDGVQSRFLDTNQRLVDWGVVWRVGTDSISD